MTDRASANGVAPQEERPRSSRTLPIWTGPKLGYLNPTEVVESLGYRLLQEDYCEAERHHFASCVERVPLHNGEVAQEVDPFEDAAAATETVKVLAAELGAAKVGVTEVDPFYVYEGEELTHRLAIVMGFTADYEMVSTAPGSVANSEILAAYDRAGEGAVQLARVIRRRGYPARAHGLRGEQLAMIPHAQAAGLGELGKHGSLINRELGCSFRLSVVTTDLPLLVDAPVDEGIDDFCSSCNMCVKHCPGEAISHEKEEVRGTTRWIVEPDKCAPYWASFHACTICHAVCPMNAGALDGLWKRTFIDTINSTDHDAKREELQAGVQEPWSELLHSGAEGAADIKGAAPVPTIVESNLDPPLTKERVR